MLCPIGSAGSRSAVPSGKSLTHRPQGQMCVGGLRTSVPRTVRVWSAVVDTPHSTQTVSCGLRQEVMTAFGQNVGQNRFWQNKCAFSQLFFVTALGQTTFGQKCCFNGFTLPHLARPHFVFWCFGYVWPNVFLHLVGCVLLFCGCCV